MSPNGYSEEMHALCITNIFWALVYIYSIITAGRRNKT